MSDHPSNDASTGDPRGGLALPVPNAEAMAHSARLCALIEARIDAVGGFVDFEQYMQLALYAPQLGYYTAGATKFGPAGDFVTAPEVSPLFGACLARQCEQVLAQCGGGDVLEYGAGTGALAGSVLTHLAERQALPQQYLVIEPSADLRARQRERLTQTLAPELFDRLKWLDAPPSTPITGIILANEVMDALPVARFRIAAPEESQSRVWEVGVTRASTPRPGVERAAPASSPDLALAQRPAPDAMVEAVAYIEGQLPEALPPGYLSEYCPSLRAWVHSVCSGLAAGAVLLVDYGLPRAEYYLAERAEGTLLCHYRHRAHRDALLYPGLQDITAWVDFSAAAKGRVGSGCSLAGYTTQAHFMAGCGIDEIYQQCFAQADPVQAARLASEARRLMLPGEMGERFRVLGLMRDIGSPLMGFGSRDLRSRLA